MTVRAALLAAAGLLVVSACGGDEPARSSQPAPALPAGFVAVQGKHYSFARPQAWKPIPVSEPEKGKELTGFQAPEAGTGGLPSQVGLGVNPDYPGSFGEAVRLAKDENKIVYPGYRVLGERTVKMAGAQVYRIDAEYEAFQEDRTKVRTIDLLVHTPQKVQMNFFVRGPAADFERAGLARIIDSFRVR